MNPLSMMSLKALFVVYSCIAQLAYSSEFNIALKNMTTLCGQYETFNTSNGLYSLETNEWGADGSGSQCVTVGNNNDTSSNSTAFAATWSWKNSASSVHAYPNARLDSAVLPLLLSNLSSLNIDVAWAYHSGSDSSGNSDFTSWTADTAKANVAIDLFLDSDPVKASTTTKPAYEIMIWLGSVGGNTPIGYSGGIVTQKTISSVPFNLYSGTNTAGQTVFSWVAQSNQSSFSGDISALVRNVAFHGGPKTSDYIGVYQFGTEALHTANGANVTFTAKSLAMGVVKGIAPVDSAAGRASGLVGLAGVVLGCAVVGALGVF